MNSIKRYVPWATWEEWMYVRQLLYSNSVEDIMEGVDIVNAWKLRASGVPVAIESTALFSKLIIKMERCLEEEEETGYSMDYDELLYSASLAMIRMVNGIIDVEQKGVYSKSVNVIAEEIGLPRAFVDLRHNCTHNDLPSFDVMLLSLKNAKLWLADFYWQVGLSDSVG